MDGSPISSAGCRCNHPSSVVTYQSAVRVGRLDGQDGWRSATDHGPCRYNGLMRLHCGQKPLFE